MRRRFQSATLRTGRMHLRYTDEGVERTLTDEQRKSEALEFSVREKEMRAVPPEMDSEDEASFQQSMPPRGDSGGGSGRPGASALSKYTGVEHRTKKVLDAKAPAASQRSASGQQHREPRELSLIHICRCRRRG